MTSNTKTTLPLQAKHTIYQSSSRTTYHRLFFPNIESAWLLYLRVWEDRNLFWEIETIRKIWWMEVVWFGSQRGDVRGAGLGGRMGEMGDGTCVERVGMEGGWLGCWDRGREGFLLGRCVSALRTGQSETMKKRKKRKFFCRSMDGTTWLDSARLASRSQKVIVQSRHWEAESIIWLSSAGLKCYRFIEW